MQNYTEKKVTILCGSIGRRAGVIWHIRIIYG